jgi:hypothetical protein
LDYGSIATGSSTRCAEKPSPSSCGSHTAIRGAYQVKIEKILNYWIVILLALMSCNSTRQADIIPDSLLIDLAAMPPNWYVVRTSNDPIQEYFNYESGANIWFNGDTNQDLFVAAHHVYELRSEKQAARTFERQLRIQFNSSSVASETPWQTPPELPYTSNVADQFHFACHISNINGLSEICKAVGQYDKYLVIFHIHVSPNYMTYTDIKSILETIDAYMAEVIDE